MNDDIKVTVVKFGDRKLLQMQFVDPLTRKKKTRSTGTTVRRDAERAAAKWESELREGRYAHAGKITWEDFRERYEREVLPGLAKTTGDKISCVFNSVEAILNPARLRELTPERLSHFQAKLREGGKAESTIAGTLAHLRAALQWATGLGMLSAVPKMDKPKRIKGGKVMKGRPISGEEFDRLLMKVEAGLAAITTRKAAAAEAKRGPRKRKWTAKSHEAVKARTAAATAAVAEPWRHYLRGLWLSGLRLRESLELYWDRDDRLCVDLDGKRPMLRIPAALEKGNKTRLLPMAPEFAEFLTATPDDQRTGPVFNLRSRADGERLNAHRVSEIVSAIGQAAGVKVNTDATSGKVKYASAHDLRRSFGARWAARVMPQVLMELMRHESIDTTMAFYVGRNAEKTADLLWQAHEAAASNTLSNSRQNEASRATVRSDANDYTA